MPYRVFIKRMELEGLTGDAANFPVLTILPLGPTALALQVRTFDA